MKIVLATGIYPPAIGGPATYVKALAEEMVKKGGHEVMVVTYGAMEQCDVVRVSGSMPVVRWFLYARALRKIGEDADVVIAFSSVSAGIPLWIARLRRPKKILRLGGDFIWERYTDRGGKKGLREWYASHKVFSCKFLVVSFLMGLLLRTFDHIVFSTRFQERIYEESYRKLPPHSVIENALYHSFEVSGSGQAVLHHAHQPFRLLFMGRMVGFKNLEAFVEAARRLNGVTLTMVGDGPMRSLLERRRFVRFVNPVHGEEKQNIFHEHDLLVLPSLTEISPNVALEARASGLPVLLTRETGLSDRLAQGMVLADLSTPEKIMQAIADVIREYDRISIETSLPSQKRTWEDVAHEWEKVRTMLH